MINFIVHRTTPSTFFSQYVPTSNQPALGYKQKVVSKNAAALSEWTKRSHEHKRRRVRVDRRLSVRVRESVVGGWRSCCFESLPSAARPTILGENVVWSLQLYGAYIGLLFRFYFVLWTFQLLVSKKYCFLKCHLLCTVCEFMFFTLNVHLENQH